MPYEIDEICHYYESEARRDEQLNQTTTTNINYIQYFMFIF